MTEPKTLREIAKIEGITHQRVVQILEKALAKVHKELQKRKIKLEDLV